jgi:hypothetical protein
MKNDEVGLEKCSGRCFKVENWVECSACGDGVPPYDGVEPPNMAAVQLPLDNVEMSFKQLPFGTRMKFLAKHNVRLMAENERLESALKEANSKLVAVDVAWGKKYNAMVETLTTSNNKKYKQLKEFVIEQKRWTVFLRWAAEQ